MISGTRSGARAAAARVGWAVRGGAGTGAAVVATARAGSAGGFGVRRCGFLAAAEGTAIGLAGPCRCVAIACCWSACICADSARRCSSSNGTGGNLGGFDSFVAALISAIMRSISRSIALQSLYE